MPGVTCFHRNPAALNIRGEISRGDRFTLFWQCPFALGWYGTECDFINFLMEIRAGISRLFERDKATRFLLDVKQCCWKANVYLNRCVPSYTAFWESVFESDVWIILFDNCDLSAVNFRLLWKWPFLVPLKSSFAQGWWWCSDLLPHYKVKGFS